MPYHFCPTSSPFPHTYSSPAHLDTSLSSLCLSPKHPRPSFAQPTNPSNIHNKFCLSPADLFPLFLPATKFWLTLSKVTPAQPLTRYPHSPGVLAVHTHLQTSLPSGGTGSQDVKALLYLVADSDVHTDHRGKGCHFGDEFTVTKTKFIKKLFNSFCALHFKP